MWRHSHWLALFVLAAGTASSVAQHPASNKSIKKAAKVTRISFGQSSGMCYGYCSSQLVVAEGSATVTLSSFNEKEKYADLVVRSDISAKRWNSLVQAFDRDGLFALPNAIGCPGCVDEPVEGIEVHFSDGRSKSVNYNLGAVPVSLRALQEQLASLEEKLRSEIPPWQINRTD
jgi:hypothetical protein